MVHNPTTYQLLKNLQQSLISIASELRQVKNLTKKEQFISLAQNSGRLEGLAQGLDFHTEVYNPNDQNSGATRVVGFRLDEANIPEEAD